MSIRDERTARTRADIIAAARRAFLNGDKIVIANLARDTGIGVATAYRYFSCPQDLLAIVMAPERRIVAAANEWWVERTPRDATEVALIEAVAAANAAVPPLGPRAPITRGIE